MQARSGFAASLINEDQNRELGQSAANFRRFALYVLYVTVALWVIGILAGIAGRPGAYWGVPIFLGFVGLVVDVFLWVHQSELRDRMCRLGHGGLVVVTMVTRSSEGYRQTRVRFKDGREVSINGHELTLAPGVHLQLISNGRDELKEIVVSDPKNPAASGFLVRLKI